MEQNVKVMQEKAVLVGLNCDLFTKEEAANERTLDELEALLETAGGVCVGKILQNRHEPDPHSFIGEGKAEEVREWVQNTGATLVIFDNDLTPSQVRALEEATKAHVLDRSALILDIFAQRAKTREGKLQVELAQYKYYLPRLTTWNEEMGRLGGGIGTRGPGETQLETDKRHIRARISKLQSELKEVRKIRAVQRERRMKNDVPVICLVGYTNAGKSTLLNALALEHVEHRLSGGALRLAVVAIALRAAAQDVAPAVVPRVIVLSFHRLEQGPRLVLRRDGEHPPEKAALFFHIFRRSLARRGQVSFCHSVTT